MRINMHNATTFLIVFYDINNNFTAENLFEENSDIVTIRAL